MSRLDLAARGSFADPPANGAGGQERREAERLRKRPLRLPRYGSSCSVSVLLPLLPVTDLSVPRAPS
jgi:hypothetical protein